MKKKTIQPNRGFYLNNKFNQVFSVWVIVFILFFGVGIINTEAYFSDEAEISGVSFESGTLDLDLDKNDLGSVGLDSDNSFVISNIGSLTFGYGISAEISDTSDLDFCNQLNVSLKEGDDILYEGLLKDLSFNGLIEKDNYNNLVVRITDPSDTVIGKTCSFNLVLKAWQEELDYTQGFTDEENILVTINSTGVVSTPTGVVLNEFLPNPDGNKYGYDFGEDSDDMPKGEWIELYNNNNTAVDLTGWYIRDNLDSEDHKIVIDFNHTGFSTPIISSHGFLVVYLNKSILNNTGGDSVRLFDNNDNLIDSYTYVLPADFCNLEPTEDGINDENGSGVGNGCTSTVPGNKSYARIPDGIGAWVDPIPTPGEENEPEGEMVFLQMEIIPKENLFENQADSIISQDLENDFTQQEEINGEENNQEGIMVDNDEEETISEDEEVVDDEVEDKDEEDVSIEKEIIIENPVIKIEEGTTEEDSEGDDEEPEAKMEDESDSDIELVEDGTVQ